MNNLNNLLSYDFLSIENRVNIRNVINYLQYVCTCIDRE